MQARSLTRLATSRCARSRPTTASASVFIATANSWPGSIWLTAARASGRSWGSNMASKSLVLTIAVATALGAATLDAQQSTSAKAQESRRFYADDPLWVDNDKRDIAPVAKD